MVHADQNLSNGICDDNCVGSWNSEFLVEILLMETSFKSRVSRTWFHIWLPGHLSVSSKESFEDRFQVLLQIGQFTRNRRDSFDRSSSFYPNF